MFQQIEQAVTTALQSAQSGGSSSDPNKVVEDAIAKVLQQNGASGGTQGTVGQPPAAGADPDGDGDTDAAGQVDGNDGSARQAFFQLLQSAGISPSQFRADLLAAIKDAQNGQSDPSTAYQNLPPGLNVNTTA